VLIRFAAGPKEAKNLAGKKTSAGFDPFSDGECGKSRPLVKTTQLECPIRVASTFSNAHDETLFVAAIRVGNRDCSRLGIND